MNAETQPNRTPTWAFRVAIACALVPLLIGLCVFAGWLVTKSEWLMVAGIFDIYLGVALFFVGAICTAVYFVTARRSPGPSTKRIGLRAALCACLLLVNFPIAGSLAFAASHIFSAFNFTIENESEKILTDVEVSGPGVKLSFSCVPPEGFVEGTMHFDNDGEVRLLATFDGEQHNEIVEGYVTRGMGGDVRILVDASGQIRVEHPMDE